LRIPAEAEKLASLIRQIQPARVQLNTVSRSPAEEFALPLSPDQMLALKGFF
jgi:wyosine [tRNA(Phe)-imidazoG37] synthetase (radical SAM superfamily)